jgi:hypothetical protein
MNTLSRTSKLNQNRIATILNGPDHTLTVENVAITLGMTKKEVAKLMSRWVGQN